MSDQNNENIAFGKVIITSSNMLDGKGANSYEQKSEYNYIQNTNSNETETYEPELFTNLNTIEGYKACEKLSTGAADTAINSDALGFMGTTIGEKSATFGSTNIAIGKRAFAANTKNIAFGNNSVAFGLLNIAKTQISFVFGYNNIADGIYSAVFGKDSETKHWGSFVTGEGNKTSHAHQTVVGRFNNYQYVDTKDSLFIVGDGVSDSARCNAMVVHIGGRVTIGSNPKNAMDVATKEYVDVNCAFNLKNGSGILSMKLNANDNESAGQGSIVFGRNNTTGDNAVNSTVGAGAYNTVKGARCFVAGFANEVDASDQIVLGAYSAKDADARLIIASGAQNAPKNVLTVKRNGILVVNNNSDNTIQLGNTTLTESKLQQLLQLI